MGLFSSRRVKSVDEKFADYVTKELGDAENLDVTEEVLQRFAQEAVDPFTDKMSQKVAELILADVGTFRQNAKQDRGFDRRLKKRWGKPSGSSRSRKLARRRLESARCKKR